MTRTHRITISLDTETLKLIDQCYEKLKPSAPHRISLATKIAYVLASLLEQWNAAEDMFSSEGDSPGPVALGTDIEEKLRELTDPNIGLKVTIKHDRTTPKDTDGLVPWEYVVAGYKGIEAVKLAAEDYTDQGEARVAIIRTVLSRIPEEHWESEQTKGILAKALAQSTKIGPQVAKGG